MNEFELERIVTAQMPEFAKVCNDETRISIFLSHGAFGLNECTLLGQAIKFAAIKGKSITIVGNTAKDV